MSNSRILCRVHGERRSSSWKLVWVTKWGYPLKQAPRDRPCIHAAGRLQKLSNYDLNSIVVGSALPTKSPVILGEFLPVFCMRGTYIEGRYCEFTVCKVMLCRIFHTLTLIHMESWMNMRLIYKQIHNYRGGVTPLLVLCLVFFNKKSMTKWK